MSIDGDVVSRVNGLGLIEDSGWNSLVDGTESADVYFRPGYVRAYETVGTCKAVAAVIDAGESRYLVPLLVRKIDKLRFARQSSGLDAMTPYGYGGILQIAGPPKADLHTIRGFFAALRVWCLEAGVISALVRLHPMFGQNEWLDASVDGGIEDLQQLPVLPTIALDLSNWDTGSAKISTLRKNRRRNLIMARKHLMSTWSSHAPGRVLAYLDIFRALYERRMDEISADPEYYFPPAYYTRLAAGLGRELDVQIVWNGLDPVAAGLFMAGKEFAHCHLSASSDAGRELGASTLLLNEAAAWSRDRDCRWLHLGGGKRGPDSLFEFKQSFGGSVFGTCYLSLIVDRARYFDLTNRRHAAEDMPPPRSNYFPEYRA